MTLAVKKTDVLPQNLIADIRAHSCAQETVHTNHRNWGADVVMFSGPIYSTTLPEALLKRALEHVIAAFPEFDFLGLRAQARHTLAGRLSYIPWHDDCNHVFSVTMYLNEVWERDWGGYFVYENDADLCAFIPHFNAAIAFRSPLQHCTTMVSIDAPLRETIQMFFDNTNENRT